MPRTEMRKKLGKILREFWRWKKPTGAYHACYLTKEHLEEALNKIELVVSKEGVRRTKRKSNRSKNLGKSGQKRACREEYVEYVFKY